MAWYDALIDQGYVPAGTTPKAVVEPGGKPGYNQTDPLSSALRGMIEFKQEQEAEQKKAQEAMDKKLDMYKTLRESGYNPQRAFDAVNKLQFPEEPGGGIEKDLESEKTQAEIGKLKAETEAIPFKNKGRLQVEILNKIATNQPLSHGEQKIYDETIKHKGNELETFLSGKDKEEHVATKERILDKIASGQALTPGEQQLYDEVIVKTGELDATIKGKTESKAKADTSQYVSMVKPDGKVVLVHPDDVAKALKKGYKRR